MGYMSSAMEATLGLPQLSVRFLADSNGWNVNGTPNLNYETNVQESAGFWMFSFQLGYWKLNFKNQIFYFQIYGNMYQVQQKICRETFVP